jgi:adenosylmethionine-8-amino-7-oxononanoate aminotransferase
MEVSHAKVRTYTIPTIKKYLDFVAGVSACTLGHQPFRVNQAIKEQLDKYSHVMVYGEYSQSPAVNIAS